MRREPRFDRPTDPDSDAALRAALQAERARVARLEAQLAALRRRYEEEQDLAEMERWERRFGMLAETLQQVFWMLDVRTGRLLYLSPAFQAIWGFPPDQLRGREDFGATVHHADRERVVTTMAERFNDGFDLRYRIVRPDGAVRWIHDRALPVRNEAGEVVQLAGIAEDVTEQIATEAELQALFAAMDDVILVLDADGRYLRVAPTGADRLYLPADQLLGRTFHEIFPADTADLFLAGIRCALETGETTQIEYLLPTKRREIWCSTRISPLSDSTVLWVSRDVTEERRAREELRRQAVVFEAISDGIVISDAEGRIVDWNPAAERLFGHARQEVLGRHPEEVIERIDSPNLTQEIAEALRQHGAWQSVERARRADGRIVTCELTVLPIRGPEGELLGTIGVNRDITERRELEEQLWHAQKLEVTGRLAGGIAHDFNNLLTAILGYSTLLESEFPEGDANRAAVREILSAADRAAALTRHLLAFARKQVARPQTLDLNEQLTRTLPLLRRMVGPQVEVVTDLPPTLTPVVLDPAQLDQVVTNLVVNARDAMPDGGTLTIRTRDVELGEEETRRHAFLRPGPYVLLEVSDTGTGMEEEVRERVFEPFFTTKEQGKGTGLGLSTVYGIVKQNEGYVLVDSQPGAGTVFRVYFSLDPRSVGRAVRSTTAHDGHGGRTVLVAEDEEGVRTLVRHVLQRAGYTVLEAADGVEAIELFEANAERIDLVLTDLLMPRASGRVLLDRVRASHPELPVVLMSGYTDPRRGEDEAATEPFLQKPFQPQELLHTVRRALGSAAPLA